MAPVIVDDHQINLIFVLGGIESAKSQCLNFASAFGSDVLPTENSKAVIGLQTQVAVWQDIAPSASAKGEIGSAHTSIDLADPVRDLLSGTRPTLCRRMILSPSIGHFLRYGDLPKSFNAGLQKKMICLEFTKSAQARISAQSITPAPLWVDPVRIERLELETGATIISVSLELARADDAKKSGKLSTTELQEAVHALSRFNTCRWYSRNEKSPISESSFSFGQIVQQLARGDTPSSVQFTRVPTYTFARLADLAEPQMLEREAAFLARRYTTDYPLDAEDADIIYLKDFRDLRHAICSEGIATVQSARKEGEETEFAQSWKPGPLAKAYLPMYELLLHENWFLTERRQDARIVDVGADILHDLESIVDDTLLFQLYFRLPSFSAISMQQNAADAVRKVLRLDEKFSFLQSTVSQIAERLRAERERQNAELQIKRDQSFGWAVRFGAASVGGLTAFTLFRDLIELILQTHALEGATAPDSDKSQAVLSGWVAAVLALATAGIVYHVSKLRTTLPDRLLIVSEAAFVTRLASILRHRK